MGWGEFCAVAVMQGERAAWGNRCALAVPRREMLVGLLIDPEGPCRPRGVCLPEGGHASVHIAVRGALVVRATELGRVKLATRSWLAPGPRRRRAPRGC